MKIKIACGHVMNKTKSKIWSDKTTLRKANNCKCNNISGTDANGTGIRIWDCHGGDAQNGSTLTFVIGAKACFEVYRSSESRSPNVIFNIHHLQDPHNPHPRRQLKASSS
jgi:hypothetical protein